MGSIGEYTRIRLSGRLSVLFDTTKNDDRRLDAHEEERCPWGLTGNVAFQGERENDWPCLNLFLLKAAESR